MGEQIIGQQSECGPKILLLFEPMIKLDRDILQVLQTLSLVGMLQLSITAMNC